MADGSMPTGPGQFPGDPMMDYLAQMRYGQPMAASPGTPNTDLSQQFENQMRAPNAMLASMTGRAMSAPEDLQRLVPGRGGSALSNAALAMSMIPTGMTIGQNIQGVSNAMTELPYARLMHAYQMLQPQLGGMQTQAGIQELLGRGEYYSGRNLASVEAMRLRDEAAAGIRAGMGKPTVQVMPGPDGKPWMGNYEVVGTDKDEAGQVVPKMKFTPVMPYKDYIASGGISGTGAVSRPANASSGSAANQTFNFLTDQLGLNKLDAYKMLQDAQMQSVLKRFGIELNDRTAVGDVRKQWAQENATAKTIHDDLLKQYPLPKTPEDAQIDAAPEYAQYITNLPKGQKAMSLQDYAQKVYTKRLQDQRNQLDDVLSGYTSIKAGDARPDYRTYMQQHLQNQNAAGPVGAQVGNPYAQPNQ